MYSRNVSDLFLTPSQPSLPHDSPPYPPLHFVFDKESRKTIRVLYKAWDHNGILKYTNNDPRKEDFDLVVDRKFSYM